MACGLDDWSSSWLPVRSTLLKPFRIKRTDVKVLPKKVCCSLDVYKRNKQDDTQNFALDYNIRTSLLNTATKFKLFPFFSYTVTL